jgi:hypothetical protein
MIKTLTQEEEVRMVFTSGRFQYFVPKLRELLGPETVEQLFKGFWKNHKQKEINAGVSLSIDEPFFEFGISVLQPCMNEKLGVDKDRPSFFSLLHECFKLVIETDGGVRSARHGTETTHTMKRVLF